MSTELAIGAVLLLCFAAGWYFTHKASPIERVDIKKVVTDFDQQKKAEATRIDGETPQQLVDDWNTRK